MNILYLDVASHNGTLACVTDKKVIAIDAVDHRIDDAELIKRIEEILKKAEWEYADLTHLACVTGPGGFTSLRVGVAAGNALAWALKIPVADVKLWEVYEERKEAKDAQETKETVWLHSTKKTHVFFKTTHDAEPKCVSLDELRDAVENAKFSWIGELIPEHQEFVRQLGMTEIPVAPLQDLQPSFLSGLRYSEDVTLLPWYGRGW